MQPLLAVLMFILGSASVLNAADPAHWRPLMLVGSDAGLILELASPKTSWEDFQQCELYRRWKESPLVELAERSKPLERLRNFNGTVAKLTGVPLLEQLLELSANGLVLAAYLPPEGEPQGILIARASSPRAVEQFVQTLEKLEPEIKTEAHEHQGERYFSRLPSGGKSTRLYFVASGDLFALSDREPRIQQLLDLRRSVLESRREDPGTSPHLTDLNAYRRASETFDEPLPTARLVLIAAPWQRVWQESASKDAFSAWLNNIWPAVFAITLDLRTRDGLHLVGRVHLDPAKTGDNWQAWTASTTNPRDFLAAVPAEAVLAAAGGIHLQPLMQAMGDITSESDREGFKRGRRLLRGFLGGKDLFTDVLPALTHDFGMYLVPAKTAASDVPFDGIVQFRFPPDANAKEMFLALDQALSSGLTLISAQANDAHDDDAVPTTVHSEVVEDRILRWLKSPLPIRVAYQLTHSGLTISRTPEALQSYQPRQPAKSAPKVDSVFLAAREKWCPNAGQIVILNAQQLQRISLTASGEQPGDARLLQQAGLISLCDVAYVAMEMDVKRMTIRLGVSAE